MYTPKTMGTDVSNTQYLQNSYINNFTQNLDSTCSANCNITVSDNSVIIGTGSSVGDITISAGNGCQADATCSMTQSADATVNNIISNMLDQEVTAVTDLFGDFQSSDLSNSTEVISSITNNITQISSQTCQANSSVSVNDNTVYIGSGSSAGDITISGGNGSSATASCSMYNMAKISAWNNLQTKDKQNGTTVGMMSMVFVVIIVLVIVGGIIAVVLISTGSLGMIFGKGGGDHTLDESEVNAFADEYFNDT